MEKPGGGFEESRALVQGRTIVWLQSLLRNDSLGVYLLLKPLEGRETIFRIDVNSSG